MEECKDMEACKADAGSIVRMDSTQAFGSRACVWLGPAPELRANDGATDDGVRASNFPSRKLRPTT